MIWLHFNFCFWNEEIMMEVIKREKEAGIVPDSDIDTYMKVTISMHNHHRWKTLLKGLNMIKFNRQLQLRANKELFRLIIFCRYILSIRVGSIWVENSISTRIFRPNAVINWCIMPHQILGLDSCADVVVGDAMKRGISGGQKKRLTTGSIHLKNHVSVFHLYVYVKLQILQSRNSSCLCEGIYEWNLMYSRRERTQVWWRHFLLNWMLLVWFILQERWLWVPQRFYLWMKYQLD